MTPSQMPLTSLHYSEYSSVLIVHILIHSQLDYLMFQAINKRQVETRKLTLSEPELVPDTQQRALQMLLNP